MSSNIQKRSARAGRLSTDIRTQKHLQPNDYSASRKDDLEDELIPVDTTRNLSETDVQIFRDLIKALEELEGSNIPPTSLARGEEALSDNVLDGMT
jgi:hypothetical protein